jgi:hypothetical protein
MKLSQSDGGGTNVGFSRMVDGGEHSQIHFGWSHPGDDAILR